VAEPARAGDLFGWHSPDGRFQRQRRQLGRHNQDGRLHRSRWQRGRDDWHGGTSGGGSVAGLPAAADILATLKLVIPYEIKLGPEDPSWVNKWTEATFYIGVMAAYLATNDQTYLTDATNWGTKNNWTLLASPTRSADNQCAGQVYEDIYLANSATATANMYASTKTSIDLVKASPKPGIVQNTDDWWWCDALFMAPGAWFAWARSPGIRRTTASSTPSGPPRRTASLTRPRGCSGVIHRTSTRPRIGRAATGGSWAAS